MDEPPRLFENNADINRIVQAALPHFIKEPLFHKIGQGLFRCALSPSAKKLHFTPHDMAAKADIRKAGIICFDGIAHADDTIGALPEKAWEFFGSKGLWPKGVGVLAYNSTVPKEQRFVEEYEWNKEKDYASDEVRKLAGQIWQAKFIGENNRLVPPEKFPGFCFLTYSFGHRMAAMAENELRRHLRERGRDDATIQKYFDRIKMVSIASSVDVGGLRENGPSIESTQIISRADRAVSYWKPFYDACIAPDAAPGYRKVDLAKIFPNDGKGHTAIVFTPAAQQREEGKRSRGHGLHHYTDLMGQLSEGDLKPLGAALAISRNKPDKHYNARGR